MSPVVLRCCAVLASALVACSDRPPPSAAAAVPDDAVADAFTATDAADVALPDVAVTETAASVCTPGATTCASGTTLKTCAADGASWLASACGYQTICTNNACLPILCTPDASSCDGPDKVLWCNDTGTALQQTGTCDPASTGVCVDGHCAPIVCKIGEKTCMDAATVGVCKADGTGFAGQACDDGDACTIDACELAGSCTATVLNCDDGDASTIDSCNKVQGCVHIQSGCWYDSTCDDQDDCTLDTCVGATATVPGTCKHEQTCTCNVLPAIACGAKLSGATQSGGSSKFLTTWVCQDGTVTGELGYEHVQQFIPACTGAMTATLTAPLSHLDLFLLDGTKDCWDNACLVHALGTTGQATLTANVTAGTVYNLAIDGSSYTGGTYTLDISCGCP